MGSAKITTKMTAATTNRVTEAKIVRMAKKRVQVATAAIDWKGRMKEARKNLPDSIGQQDVIVYVTTHYPDLNKLTLASRWRNAWLGRAADPEITKAVEQAAVYFQTVHTETAERLKRQKLAKPQKPTP
jgi:hypothetical protein